MKLSEKRHLFRRMKSMLLEYGELLGYRVVEDEGKRCDDCPNTHPRSAHKVGLAIDLILYDDQWEPVWDNAPFAQLHELWDLLGGARRIDDDLGHFSLEHNGVR
jgi:hypothetical protein